MSSKKEQNKIERKAPNTAAESLTLRRKSMAEAKGGSTATASSRGSCAEEMSLKDQGNEFFKSGKYLKAAALYTQAIKQDPSNPTLYRYSSYAIFIFNQFFLDSVSSESLFLSVAAFHLLVLL